MKKDSGLFLHIFAQWDPKQHKSSEAKDTPTKVRRNSPLTSSLEVTPLNCQQRSLYPGPHMAFWVTVVTEGLTWPAWRSISLALLWYQSIASATASCAVRNRSNSGWAAYRNSPSSCRLGSTAALQQREQLTTNSKAAKHVCNSKRKAKTERGTERDHGHTVLSLGALLTIPQGADA